MIGRFEKRSVAAKNERELLLRTDADRGRFSHARKSSR